MQNLGLHADISRSTPDQDLLRRKTVDISSTKAKALAQPKQKSSNVPISSTPLKSSSLDDSPQGTLNDDHPEDILFDSLQMLYDCQPVTFTSPGTSYIYTHAKSIVSNGQVTIVLQTPDPDAANWHLHASSVWIASIQLARGIELLRIDSHLKRMAFSMENSENNSQRRLRVLELGASAGLPSILIAKLYPNSVSVLATDYPDSQLIQTLAYNIEQNAVESNCRAAPHAWGTDPTPLFSLASDIQSVQTGFDVIIAADTLWNSDSHPIFINTLQLALRKDPNARVHLVAGLHTGRYTIESFLRSIVQAGFRVADIKEREVMGSGGGDAVKARTRMWDVTRAEHEQEKDRRAWAIWIELCWEISQLSSENDFRVG